MASLRIMVPDGTTNYVKNPALRYDTTGYTANGATVTRSTERARFGLASLKVVTAGSAFNEGAFYRVSWLNGTTSPITASVYLRGAGKVRIRLVDNWQGGQFISKAQFLTDERWTRFDVSGRCNGSDDIRIYVESADALPKAITFYADGFQIEAKAYVTSYVDGDQPGCMWNVVKHGSISTRSATSRAGGRYVELANDDRPEKNIYMTVIGGLGVGPMRSNVQSFADAPGSYYQNTKLMDRVITITFHATAPDIYGTKPVSLRDLHALRKTLFDIIRPDKTYGSEEFTLEYQDGEFPVYLRARYEGGMEGSWDVRNKYVQSFPVRFRAVSPILFDDNYEVSSLNFQDRTIFNYVMQRVDGVWGRMNGGLNSYVNRFAFGNHGELIAGGAFSVVNNSSTAIDPTLSCLRIGYWDGTRWQKFGSGASSPVYDIAVAPNGDIYIAGGFTSVGGVSANGVAKWNGSTWEALGSGINAIGYAIAIAPNGNVYVGGNFTTAGGKTVGYCAYYDGANWQTMGNELGLNSAVYSIAISQDGSQVYLGGNFTDERGSPGNLALNYIALYEPAFDQFAVLGDGFDAFVRKVFLSSSGRLYAGGNFTESGTQVMLYISYWNGAAWYGLDLGADDLVFDIDENKEGHILATGNFTRMGSTSARGVALYNGATWTEIDGVPNANCYGCKFDQYGNIYLSMNGTVASFAKRTTVNVKGTMETHPTVYIKGPCTLRWLENQTTKKRIYADLDILTGEEVIFEFATGKVTSNARGDISYALMPGSDLHAWTLIPGDNIISALMINDMSAIMNIYYAPRHWSADSMADEEGF